MNYEIPDEYQQLADLARQFVQRELWPHEKTVEALDEVPRDIRDSVREKALETGLYAFNMPETCGGPGLPFLAQVLIREQLGHANVALANLVGRPPSALLACSDEQRDRYLTPAVRGEKTWAFALTEPGAGSDVMAMNSRAHRETGGWRLNGAKHFISHGGSADYVLVIAKAQSPEGSGLTAFVVPQGRKGFTIGRQQQKMGWRGYPICELFFDDVFVPDEDVLGGVGQGLKLGLSNIQEARVGVAAHCLGIAQRAFGYAVEHLRVRSQFGRPLANFQGLQWMVADMVLDIEQSRALVYAAARALDSGRDARQAVSMAKLSATEMGSRVVDQALQLLGGAGYMTDTPLEMLYRDVRAFRIGEGTSEIQKNQIARAVLGKEVFV